MDLIDRYSTTVGLRWKVLLLYLLELAFLLLQMCAQSSYQSSVYRAVGADPPSSSDT